MELASNVMENSTSVDGSSFKSDNEAINNKTQTAQRHMDRKHKHSKAHSRSKEFESERRMSSASKRTLAQMTQTAKTHDENTPMKRSDSKLYRRSSYKIANKPSTSPRISQSASSRTSVEMKPSRHLRPTAQDKTRPSTHGKGRRYGRDREPSTGSKTSQRVVDPSSSTSSQKKFPESLGETVFEGPLKSKNTFVDGKYSVDRAWKSTYVVLRGHCLCLHPDKNSQTLVVYDHPIFIGSALVDIAYDYTKRANVFRVTTLNFSEFLFEAQTSELMLDWIHMLQKQGLAYSQDFLKRKILSSSLRLNKSPRSHSRGQQKQQALSLDDPASTTTPTATTTTMATTTASSNVATATTTGKQSKQDFLQPSNFLMRFRSKSPEGRRFKGESTSPGKDHHHHHENKAKSWREKVAERFRRANSHPGTTAQGTPSNNAGPLLSPPSIQYDKVSFPSSSGEDQSEGVLGCLGVSLEKCVVSPNNEHLPLIVETCIDIIESQGLTNRGIYRVPGNSAAITTLQSQVEKDPVTLNRDHEKWNDTNAVVSLLKLFFRKLPEPLVTKELYQSFIEANHNEDKRKRLLKIKKLIHLLPMRNFQTFKSLATHLNKVSTFEKTNMMDARNLAIVFGPTLLQPAEDKNMVNMVKDMNDQCQIVESVIANYKWFFGSWEEDVPFPGVDDTKNEPVTSMESQLIEKAQQHLEMSTGGGSKKSRFTSLVSQSSNPKIPKKETEGSAKGMTVFSVESVYWEVEKSSDSFEYQRSSKFKSHERSRVGSESGDPTDRRSNPSEKQERTSRKKFRGDFDTDKSTCSISEDGIYHSEKQVEALHPTGHVKHVRSRASRVSDVSEDAESDNFSRKDMSRRRSYNVASDALKVEGDGRAGRRVSGSSQLKPSVQSMDYSSGDSCFFDPLDDPPHVREQHRRPRKHIQAERNVRNIPASSLLQPPRTKFRSRSSQKHSKKAPFRPLQTAQQVVSQAALNPSHEISGSGNISTNSMDNLISSGNHSQHLWKESNKAKQSLDAQTSSFVDPQNAVTSLELPPSSDLLVTDTATKKPDSLNDPADDLLKIASLSLQVQKNDIENSTDKKVASSDSVFYDQNDFGQGDDKKVQTFPRKRSMSADTLFQKVGSSWLRNLLGKEEGVETQRLLPPSRTDVRLKPKHSNLFLSLHSLRSPTKLKKSFQFEKLPQSSPLSTLTSIQQRANLNVVRNLFSEIHLDPKSPGNRGGTEKRNAIKRLIRTWSSGNCFGKDVLSSPTSTKGAGGSLSYESSV